MLLMCHEDHHRAGPVPALAESRGAAGAREEIIVTRDGKPVAKLVRVRELEIAPKRFNPRRHARWQAKVSGRRTVRWVEEFLIADRQAREVGASRAPHRQ